MSRKPHIIFIIAAIILIPILLGATPIKIVKKLVGECPFVNGKVAMCSIPCIFNAVTSQSHTDNIGDVELPSPLVLHSTTPLVGETTENHVVTITNYFIEAPPLRC